MKIELTQIDQITIEDFADKNSLVMEVKERPYPIGNPARFYAHFKNAKVQDGCMLITDFGDGKTPDDAIADYASKITLKTLVFNSFRPNRFELQVPRLTLGKV